MSVGDVTFNYLLTCCRRSLADKTMKIRRCHCHRPPRTGVVLRHGSCRRSPGQRRECTSTIFKRTCNVASSTTLSPSLRIDVRNHLSRVVPRVTRQKRNRLGPHEEGQFPPRTLIHPIASSALPPSGSFITYEYALVAPSCARPAKNFRHCRCVSVCEKNVEEIVINN